MLLQPTCSRVKSVPGGRAGAQQTFQVPASHPEEASSSLCCINIRTMPRLLHPCACIAVHQVCDLTPCIKHAARLASKFRCGRSHVCTCIKCHFKMGYMHEFVRACAVHVN